MARGALTPPVKQHHLARHVYAEAGRVERGLRAIPVVRIEVRGAEARILLTDGDQPTVEARHRQADAITGKLPADGPRTHAPTGASVVLRNPVVLRELLTGMQHGYAWSGEQRDGIGLGTVPLEATDVVTRAALPGDVGVVVVGQVQ